ncbi:colicin E3/pyocin S6 family cytotoxin [Brevibacillus parabrevis]|nr:colicin E3/pyocin S6 family cytotoxin [Brevibacillus parabrevis]
MVMNSVRHAPQGEAVQKQAKKMQDPGVKSFGNPQGKEFTLGDKELTMTAQEGLLYISMNQDAGVSFNSASQVRIQASGGLSLHGAAVTLTASEGLSIKTIVDHMGLQEEISASSEEIKLDATTRRSFPHLWSAFEEKVQSIGVDGIIKERIQANMDAEVKVTKEFWSENMSAFWAATVDTADIVFSTLSFGYSENVYEWASGKEVGSLTERNLMVQGLQKTAEDAFTYAEKVITGEKSKLEVAGDALDAGWGILKEAVEPFIEEAQYLIEDAKGGKWTRSIEESYEKGRNSAKKDLVILELVGSRGLFGAYRKAVKKVRDQGGNDSKASHTSDVSDHEQGQQKDGNGAALPLQGANDHHRNSTGQKDGKLKTKAEIPLDEIQNLQDVIDLLILKMNRKLDGRIVIGQTSADGIGGVGGYHVFFEADQRGRGGSKDKGGETRRTERTGNDAYGGYFKRKQQRTEEYNSKIADKQKIVGDDTNGYRLVEPTKWMEQMGMTQIKEKLKRKSWSDNNGFNWQWDSQHGKLEKWNKRRTEHLGEFDPVTGKQTKDGEPKRRWDG